MVKAVVAGASGGIGQPLSLLMKISPLIDELALYDVMNIHGPAADIFHISTPVKSAGYLGPKNLQSVTDQTTRAQKEAFMGADLVIVPAGMPRLPGMTRDQLFDANADIVRGITESVAEYAPNAFLLIISNPVNSMVPVAAETLKAKGVFNPKRLFGVTTLDLVRAKTFIAGMAGINPSDLYVPVIGGHSGHTILPILSQAKPSVKVSTEEIPHIYGPTFLKPAVVKIVEVNGKKEEELLEPAVMGHTNVIERIQYGGDEVVNAKGVGSATLSMAYAGFTFAEKVLKAAKGEKGITECTYVYLPGIPGGDVIAKETGCDFFSVPVEFGPNGAEKAINILNDLNADEKDLLNKCIEGFTKTFPPEKVDHNGNVIKQKEPEFVAGLKANIEKGVNYKPTPKEK